MFTKLFTESFCAWEAAVVSSIPLSVTADKIKLLPEIELYCIISLLIFILPEAGIWATEATGIVVTVAFIAEVKVVVIPSEAPSLGDLKITYSFWPLTKLKACSLTCQKWIPLLSHSWSIMFNDLLAERRSLPE